MLVPSAAIAGAPAAAQNVKITPLGSHEGEFCPFDRALVFEDPDGTRILYDAGRTVRGPEDPRLGKIDAVLLSHVHSDHLGGPHSVIASHANEPATIDGRLTPNSKTAAFQKAAKMPVHVPLSGRTMEFDRNARCVAGC
jgi:glyoxylase-like metal-dependent hydrolase (beta-lactamase superfamily II)